MVRLPWAMAVILGWITLFSTTESWAQFRRGHPPIARFVGTIEPFDKKAASDLNTLTMSYKEHQWLFRVEQLKVMGAGGDSGMMLLKRIYPPQLSLSGPDLLLEPLGDPEHTGKRWILEGMLYVRNRRYYVATVKAAPAESQ